MARTATASQILGGRLEQHPAEAAALKLRHDPAGHQQDGITGDR
jgi:hypothetical protein